MSVTMADVARLAGVNKATVSRALKGDPRISAVTREKVWKAARSLGYEPDALARGLSTHTSDLVGVVFNSLSEPWTGLFLAGLERVLLRHRVEMIVKSTSGSDEQAHNVLRALRSRKVDGVIWISPAKIKSLTDIPVISVGRVYDKGYSILMDMSSLCEKLASLSESPWSIFNVDTNSFIDVLLEQLKSLQHPVARKIMLLKTEDVAITDPPILFIGSSPVLVNQKGYCLSIPFFELGTITGRVFLNSLQDRGVRPSKVLMTPSISLKS